MAVLHTVATSAAVPATALKRDLRGEPIFGIIERVKPKGIRMKKASIVRLAGFAALGFCFCLQAEELAPFPKWSEPRAITKGPHEHFFASYFAIDSWSPNKRYVSVLETDLNGRLPEAGERCTALFFVFLPK